MPQLDKRIQGHSWFTVCHNRTVKCRLPFMLIIHKYTYFVLINLVNAKLTLTRLSMYSFAWCTTVHTWELKPGAVFFCRWRATLLFSRESTESGEWRETACVMQAHHEMSTWQNYICSGCFSPSLSHSVRLSHDYHHRELSFIQTAMFMYVFAYLRVFSVFTLKDLFEIWTSMCIYISTNVSFLCYAIRQAYHFSKVTGLECCCSYMIDHCTQC